MAAKCSLYMWKNILIGQFAAFLLLWLRKAAYLISILGLGGVKEAVRDREWAGASGQRRTKSRGPCRQLSCGPWDLPQCCSWRPTSPCLCGAFVSHCCCASSSTVSLAPHALNFVSLHTPTGVRVRCWCRRQQRRSTPSTSKHGAHKGAFHAGQSHCQRSAAPQPQKAVSHPA